MTSVFGQLNYITTLYNIFIPIVMSVGLIGNVMVIMVVFRNIEMRKSTNIFLANLAITDLIYLLTTLPKDLIYANTGQDIAASSDGMCKGMLFIQYTAFHTSVLIILAIGFERYYAVCQPIVFGLIFTKKRAYVISLVAWSTAALFVSPLLLFMFRHPEEYVNGTVHTPTCDFQDNVLWMLDVIIVISFTAFYILPLIILMIMFIIIARHLKKAAASGVSLVAMRHRSRVVKMVAVVVMLFFICHLPIRIIYIVCKIQSSESNRRETLMKYRDWRFIGAIPLYLHSIVNPILYNFMSERFRTGFRKIVCDIGHRFEILQKCWCFCTETRNTAVMQMNTRETESV